MFGLKVFALGRKRLAIAVVGLVAVFAALVGSAAGAPKDSRFDQINVVSDLPGVAAIQDTLLVNPWGLALAPTQPALGGQQRQQRRDPLPRRRLSANPFAKVALEVGVTNGAPTGQVFNGTGSFVVGTPPAGGPARFMFDSQSGDITGWNPAAEPRRASSPTSDGAIYRAWRLLQTPPSARSCSRPTSTMGASTCSTQLQTGRPRRGVHRPAPAHRLRTVQRHGRRRAVYVTLRQAGRRRARTRSPGPASAS